MKRQMQGYQSYHTIDFGRGLVTPGQVDEMACIIIDLLRAPIGRARFKPVAEMLRWSRVAEPLACYIAAPWRNGERAMGLPASVRPITLLAKLPGKAVSVLLRRGPIRLLREIYAYLIWRWERS